MSKRTFYFSFIMCFIYASVSKASVEVIPSYEFKVDCFLGRNSIGNNHFESTIPLKKREQTSHSVYDGYLQKSIEVKIKSNNGKLIPVEVIPNAYIVYSSMNRTEPHFTLNLSIAAKMSKGNLFETDSDLIEYSLTEMDNLSLQNSQKGWFKVTPSQVLKGDIEGKIKKDQTGRYDFFDMKIIGHCELMAKKV
ncbi:MAG: hypothetical protein ACOVP4_08810 [Bacteriovoracaceae bacterium]